MKGVLNPFSLIDQADKKDIDLIKTNNNLEPMNIF